MDLKKKIRNTEKLVFGKQNVLKLARKEKLEEVILPSNSVHKEEFIGLRDDFGIKVEEIKQNSEELGALCKKPFSISILGIKK